MANQATTIQSATVEQSKVEKDQAPSGQIIGHGQMLPFERIAVDA